MSTEILVAIIGLAAAVIGLIAALVARGQKHEFTVVQQPSQDESGAKARSASPATPHRADPPETTRQETRCSPSPPRRDSHVALTVRFLGHPRIYQPRRVLGLPAAHEITATVMLDGKRIGEGSLTNGFELSSYTRPGRHKVILAWRQELECVGRARTFEGRKEVEFQIDGLGPYVVDLEYDPMQTVLKVANLAFE